jgi:arylsulfatase A-like enzyme
MNCIWKTWFVLAFLFVIFGSENVQAAKQPNLIVIMADDLGYADVGFNGCRDIPTPNIDRIAQGGVKCTSGYVAYSVCSPSRAGFITGRYGHRFGYERNAQYQTGDPNMGLAKEERTIADVLKPVGYTSGVIGKWHLGAHLSNHPLNRGFDFFYGHLGGGHQYMPELLNIKDSYAAKDEAESYRTWILRNHEAVPPRKYLTEEFSEAAVEFVEAEKDSPFFLYLAYNAPHGPLQATEKYLSRLLGIKDTKRKTYAAMVSAVDDGVGLLLDKLDELKLTENTIVIFLSDNGGPESANASDNGKLRGGKGDAWEGGYRVPFAVQWKGKLPAGVDYDLPVSSLDIMATIADLSKAPLNPERPLDGVNLIPYLTGQKSEAPHDAIYLRQFDQNKYAVRSGDYKMVIPFKNGKSLLYNLNVDIGEADNIADRHPETLQRLETMRVQWDSELVEPRFLGLIHLDNWKLKFQKRREATDKWFAAMDKNEDGRVTEAEWLTWSKADAAQNNESNKNNEQQMLFSIDIDGNGVVTREELYVSVK